MQLKFIIVSTPFTNLSFKLNQALGRGNCSRMGWNSFWGGWREIKAGSAYRSSWANHPIPNDSQCWSWSLWLAYGNWAIGVVRATCRRSCSQQSLPLPQQLCALCAGPRKREPPQDCTFHFPQVSTVATSFAVGTADQWSFSDWRSFPRL